MSVLQATNAAQVGQIHDIKFSFIGNRVYYRW